MVEYLDRRPQTSRRPFRRRQRQTSAACLNQCHHRVQHLPEIMQQRGGQGLIKNSNFNQEDKPSQ